MKIAMAQMSMTPGLEENLEKTLAYLDAARDCDLLFFPEIQLCPFFPQHRKLESDGQRIDSYALTLHDPTITRIRERAALRQLYVSPNLYLQVGPHRFDASLWITPTGELEGISKMVHIAQADQFYEQDYYTPSDQGFRVYTTPWGKVGIVICFDRHLPESIRTCAILGADLVIIPTANTKAEPMEMFAWELRVQAFQNNVFIAMCNRVGVEDAMEFSGESLVIDPHGEILLKLGDQEGLGLLDLRLEEAGEARRNRPYIQARRPEWYL